MKNLLHKFIFCALIVILAINITAQTRYSSLFTADNSYSRPAWLQDAVSDAVILNVDAVSLQRIIASKENSIILSLPIENGTMTDVMLERFDIINENTRIVEGTTKGDVPFKLANNFVSYRGYIEGVNRALVSITFSSERITGLVSSSNETFVIGKLSEHSGKYLLYRTSKLKITDNFNCGSEALEIPGRINNLHQSFKDNLSNTLLSANMAIETDYETYVRYGTVQNTTIYLLSLMSTVSAVYVRDINVKLIVTYLRVWTTSADPYNGTTSNALLNEFRSYWLSNMSGVPRTIAHYITTRPGNLGGIAWLNVLCANLNSGYGFAFSNINGTFNNLPVYSWDVDVVCHETGHNFGSPHTHNCGWPGGPIDSCYAVEGGCYTGPVIPRIGTIMSYCHLNAGKVLNFGPLPTDLIRQYAEAASCLGTISGFFVAKPNGGELFRSGDQTLVIWGTSTTGNVNIELSTNNGTNWQVIQNNVSAILRNYTWTIPYIPTTTQAIVRVSESGNPGTNDVSDSIFQVRPTIQQFNMTEPIMFSRIYVSPNDTSKVFFKWTRSGTLPEFKYKWYITTFSNLPVYNQFSNNSGSDTVLTLTKGRIDSIIAAYGINTGDSLRGKWLVKTFTQLDSLPPTTSNFIITFIRSLIGINPISSIVPKEFFVNQNYPNPFNPTTKIKFGLPKNDFISAKVYEILGREVQVLANENLKPGEYEIEWNASSLPSGVYFIKITGSENVKILRSVIVK